MQEWAVLKKEEFDISEKGDFIEISLKEHPESKEELFAISKGWKNIKGFKKYKSNIVLSQDSVSDLISTLNKLREK